MTDRIAEKIHQDLDHAASIAMRGDLAARLRDDRDSLGSGSRFQEANRFRCQSYEVDAILVLLTLIVHRTDDGEQMPRGGRNVAGIIGIIGAQRSVGLLNDPVRAFDDAVQRRSQRFVDDLVELGSHVARDCLGRSGFAARFPLKAGEPAVSTIGCR